MLAADWAPDGHDLAVVRSEGARRRLEFPIGRVLFESDTEIGFPRVSPKGDRVAFLQSEPGGGSVETVDLQGGRTTLSKGHVPFGLAWAPSGNEVWFTEWGALYAVTLAGNERLLARFPGAVTINDVSRDGRALLTLAQFQSALMVLAPGASEERDLSWFDASQVTALSPDGKTMLFADRARAGSIQHNPNDAATYLRPTDGSAAVRLGEGTALQLSPDGRWALSLVVGPPPRLTLLPTGPGEPRPVPVGGLVRVANAALLPHGEKVIIAGQAPDEDIRVFVQDLAGRDRRALTPEGFELSAPVSPDGNHAIVCKADGKPMLLSIDSADLRPLPGGEPGDLAVGWSAEGRWIYVVSRNILEIPARIYRIEIASGRRELWREMRPRDAAAFGGFTGIFFTPDGKSYAYSFHRFLCSLYLVDGLR